MAIANELTIEKQQNGAELTLALIGRLDTLTAPELEATLKESLEGVTSLTFDVSRLDYVSSAGLRVFLLAQKTMNRLGTMKILHPTEDVYEIFDVTGFTDIFTIEQ